MKSNLPVFILLLLASILCGQVDFTSGPTAGITGGKSSITFTVSTSTDIEVGVLNSRGKIVKHLAAGVLGGAYPPPAPLQNSLAQELVWDGLDDTGALPDSPPFRFRVRLGVHPVFKRAIDLTEKLRLGGKSVTTDGTRLTLDPQETYMTMSHPIFNSGNTTYPMYAVRTQFDFVVSDQTDEVLVKGWNGNTASDAPNLTLFRFDGLTGAYLRTTSFTRALMTYESVVGSAGYAEPYLSWDGQFIYYNENGPGRYYRYDLNGAAAPFPGLGTHVASDSTRRIGSSDLHALGHTCGPDGSMYVLHYRPTVTLYQVALALTRVKDGIILDPPVMDVIESSVSGGVRVDSKGNIFLAAGMRPITKNIPDFVKAESLSGAYTIRLSQKYAAKEMIGSILKFSPAGGRITTAGGDADSFAGMTCATNGRVHVEGMEWYYHGYSHVLVHGQSGIANCWCNQTRFDVDRFDRIFFPNTFMYEINAIDNNRNVIFKVKNRDIPELDMGFGHQVEVTDNNLYVGDYFHNKVAVLELTPDRESLVEVVAAERAPAGLSAEVSASPNPFNPDVTLHFYVPATLSNSRAVWGIYDIGNRLIRSYTPSGTGRCTIRWDGRDNAGRLMAGGIYFFRAISKKWRIEQRLVLVR